ncbi:MAG: carbohydrate ABC transporter permease [Clostridia bacterium]|nr:carbohydrate ABC transporter permease [Clostridia bacterium]
MSKLRTGRMLGRSRGGNFVMFFLLFVCGAFMVLPIVYSILQSLKPLNEINLFPPRFFVTRPTLSNYKKLLNLSANLWVPFSRYVFNSFFISITVTVLSVLISSMCAYPLAKYQFPGSKWIFRIIVLALLFSTQVTYIPQYVLLSKMKMINTYWAMILPPLSGTLGLYLMKQYMTALPDSLLEAAKLDGAGEYRVFWTIVMPNVKPAWLTLVIFSFQSIWNSSNNSYIYKEQLKMLPTVMSQMAASGVARVGVGAAASVVLMIPVILLFIFTQRNIIDTMANSGMKD